MAVMNTTYAYGSTLAEFVKLLYAQYQGTAAVGVYPPLSDAQNGSPNLESQRFSIQFSDGTIIDTHGLHQFVKAFVDAINTTGGKTITDDEAYTSIAETGLYGAWIITVDA